MFISLFDIGCFVVGKEERALRTDRIKKKISEKKKKKKGKTKEYSLLSINHRAVVKNV